MNGKITTIVETSGKKRERTRIKHHENICKKYDFKYDRNQYTIKYVYIYVLTIPYSEKYLAKKKAQGRPDFYLRICLSGAQKKYFIRPAHINTNADFL